MRRRGLRRGVTAVVLLAAFALALLLAVGQLGVVTTHGISMLPTFHTGDLAVLWRAGGYHVGEVVAYKSPLLRTTVLHRIVSEQGGLFSFKGDNNHWLDPQRLPASAIVGTVLWRIPHGGDVLHWLRAPVHLAVIVVVLVAIGTLLERRHLRSRRPAAPATPGGPQVVSPLLAWGLALLALAGAATAIAYATGATSPATTEVGYREHLTVAYHGRATPGAAYPTGEIVNGQPIYLKLVHGVALDASWRLSGPSPEVNGTIALTVSLHQPDGWSRPLVTVPARPFVGTTATAVAPLPLASAAMIMRAASASTGVVSAGDSLVVNADVDWSGTVDGVVTSGTMAPAFSFEIDGLEVNLASVGSLASLSTTHPGRVALPTRVGRTVPLFGHAVELATLRKVALGAMALGALVFLVGLAVSLADRRDETTRLLRRVRDDLVTVTSDPRLTGHPVLDVARLGALVELAARHEAPLLEHSAGDGRAFYVEVGGILYRYPLEAAAAEPAEAKAALITLPARSDEPTDAAPGAGGSDGVASVVNLEPPALRVVAPPPEEPDLGLNAWFVEEQRRAYERDPLSVPASWRTVFGSEREAASERG